MTLYGEMLDLNPAENSKFFSFYLFNNVSIFTHEGAAKQNFLKAIFACADWRISTQAKIA